MSLELILLLVAFILFLMSAFALAPGRVVWGWLGAALVTLTLIV